MEVLNMKMNAKIIDGKYKDQAVEIKFGRNAMQTHIMINGEPIDNCRRVEIICDARKPTNIVRLEFSSSPREIEMEENDV